MAFLETYPAETPLRKVANVKQQARIANILMDIEGVGVVVQRDFSREGRGWKIVVDPESLASAVAQGVIDTDTEVDLTPQLRVHEDGGDYTVEVRMKKLTFEFDTASNLTKPVASDTWGAWHGVDACPPPEDYTEIYGGDI